MLVSAVFAAERPNVIVILADDMGFSDLGAYGGEIETPNLDALAENGVRFSQFYNSARCCPTRASLMSGLHPHQAGIGYMTKGPQQQIPEGASEAYQGILSKNTVTIAEALKSSGYATLMTGKWHLGQQKKEQWPLQRGFDRYYGCLSGATLYFKPDGVRNLTLDNTPQTEHKSTTDRPFYTTDAFTDHAISFIKETEKPFFLYLAYTAPHWPIQAHEEDIAKYRGKYKDGWDKLRKARHDRQVKMGLIDPSWKFPPRDKDVPAWDSLTEEKRDEMELRMAIYAAMVDRLDQNVGKLIKHLKDTNRFDNTLILFLSDNGACAEMGILGNNNVRDIEKRNADLHIAYGTAWANVSSTPFRLYKHFAHEGGTATPFIAHWPAGIKKRKEWLNTPGQIIDIMPTILDVSGATYPGGKPPLPGVSLKPAFEGGEIQRSQPLFMEHENNAFVRDGEWKLVGRNVAPKDGLKPGRWQLYNIKKDRTETNNLAAQMPEKVKEMSRQWEEWSKSVGVYPKP